MTRSRGGVAWTQHHDGFTFCREMRRAAPHQRHGVRLPRGRPSICLRVAARPHLENAAAQGRAGTLRADTDRLWPLPSARPEGPSSEVAEVNEHAHRPCVLQPTAGVPARGLRSVGRGQYGETRGPVEGPVCVSPGPPNMHLPLCPSLKARRRGCRLRGCGQDPPSALRLLFPTSTPPPQPHVGSHGEGTKGSRCSSAAGAQGHVEAPHRNPPPIRQETWQEQALHSL